MSENNISIKDSRELIRQLHNLHSPKVAAQIVTKHNYSEQGTRDTLQQLAREDPDEYRLYKRMLRREIREGKKNFDELAMNFRENNPEQDQLKKEQLRKRVIYVNQTPTPEMRETVQNMFPSGNFMSFAARVEDSLNIIQDQEGAIQSVAGLRKNNPKFRGKGGYFGISFNYNGIKALPGTPRHLTMFVTSPELALKNGQKLVVPFLAAENEMQLVTRNYDIEMGSYVTSSLDFLGFTNIFGENIMGDFIELEESVKSEKRNSGVEKDLKRIKNGKLKLKKLRELYTVVDGEMHVSPAYEESDVSPATIYSDYLLTSTVEGQKLGKTIETITPQELIELEKQTRDVVRNLRRKLENIAESLHSEVEAQVKVEDCLMFVPESDLDFWIDVYSRVRHSPKAIVVYSNQTGPRIDSWIQTEGHKERAEEVVRKTLANSGVQKPSIPYSDIVGKNVSKKDLGGKVIKYLKWDLIKNSKQIKLNGNKLEVF